MRRVAIAGCIQALVAASVGCSLVESFDGYTDGGQPLDALAPDTGGRDAAQDTSRDAPFIPIKDTGAKHDSAEQPDSTTATESGPMTCPDDSPFNAVPWAPPTPLYQGVCTSAETMEYLATFNSAVTTSGNATCDACIQTDVSAAQHGPIITALFTNGIEPIEINAGGCLANFDGSTAPGCCGNVVNNGSDCIAQECGDCSDFPNGQGGPTDACKQMIQNGVCSGAVPSNACYAELGASNVQVCLANLQGLLDVWCGPPADAGGPVDAGREGAADAADQ